MYFHSTWWLVIKRVLLNIVAVLSNKEFHCSVLTSTVCLVVSYKEGFTEHCSVPLLCTYLHSTWWLVIKRVPGWPGSKSWLHQLAPPQPPELLLSHPECTRNAPKTVTAPIASQTAFIAPQLASSLFNRHTLSAPRTAA